LPPPPPPTPQVSLASLLQILNRVSLSRFPFGDIILLPSGAFGHLMLFPGLDNVGEFLHAPHTISSASLCHLPFFCRSGPHPPKISYLRRIHAAPRYPHPAQSPRGSPKGDPVDVEKFCARFCLSLQILFFFSYSQSSPPPPLGRNISPCELPNPPAVHLYYPLGLRPPRRNGSRPFTYF